MEHSFLIHHSCGYSNEATDMEILVVEDDLLTAEDIAAFLRDQTMEVRTAVSVGIAIQHLAAWAPDLIITDVGLENEDAFSLLDWLESSDRTSKIPVIALSGYSLTVPQRARFTGYLSKPVDQSQLLVLIHTILKD